MFFRKIPYLYCGSCLTTTITHNNGVVKFILERFWMKFLKKNNVEYINSRAFCGLFRGYFEFEDDDKIKWARISMKSYNHPLES